MSAKHIAIPDGCLSCNREQRSRYLVELEALEIHIEAVPTPTLANPNIVVCRRCGQAWLLMPKQQADLPT